MLLQTVEDYDRALSALKALSEHLNKIDHKKVNGVNIFYAVGMQTQEIKHSAFLAWLFKPNNPHGLDTNFIRKFLEYLFTHATPCADFLIDDAPKTNREILQKFCGISSMQDLEEFLRAKDISVITERSVEQDGRIDIFVESPSSKTLIVIENKVFTGTHDNQLKRYEDEFQDRSEWKRIYVFLTPSGDFPFDDDGIYRENWCVYSYGTVLEIVREFAKEVKSRKLKYIMEDYIEMVNTEILKKKKELQALCRQIRREHADALTILEEYTDSSDKIIEECKRFLLKEYGEKVTFVGNTTTGNLDFYTAKAKQYFETNGEEFEKNNSFKFLYQIRKGGGYKYCWYVNKVDDTWSNQQRELANKIGKSLNRKQDGEDIEKTSFCNLCKRVRFLSDDDLWREYDERTEDKIINGLSDFVKAIRKFEDKYFTF